CDWLSRPRSNFRRHGVESDRPGRRGDRHHHGGLPHDQPRDLRPDESLQPPHGPGRTMSDLATTTDAKLIEGPAFVRRQAPAPLRPRRRQSGAIGWLRQNLFSSPGNIALTVLCALFIVWALPPLVKFLFIDAVWDGAGRDDCLARPDHPEMGACWAFVKERINFFIYGFYPVE